MKLSQFFWRVKTLLIAVTLVNFANMSAQGQNCAAPHIPLPDGDLVNKSIPAGGSAYYCCALVYGTAPFTYQWLLNGSPIPAATNQCYYITNAGPGDAGYYQVQVFNACGSDITGTNWPGYSGFVTVGNPPSLVQPFQEQDVVAGQTATFTVNVSGDQPLTFFWYTPDFGAGCYIGQCSNVWSVPNAQSGGRVFVQVGNAFGTNTYQTQLTVSRFPTLTTQPLGKTVLVGSNATLTVDGYGTSGGSLSFQWQFQGTNLPGATSSSLVLTNLQVRQSGPYNAVLYNPAGSTNSATAPLDVRYAFLYASGQFLAGTNYHFTSAVMLQLSGAFPNGSIYYTLDGSTPTFASTYYTGPFTLSQNAIVRALCYSADFSQSGEIAPVSITIGTPYSLSASTSGGGTVSLNPPGGSYLSGTSVQVTATPSSGWAFLGWLGDLNGSSNPATVVVSRNMSVQAVFGTSLSTTVAGSGTVSINPNLTQFPFGAVACLSAIPQSGNYFGVWGNAASGNTNPLYFTITNPNPTVSSLFAALGPNQYALTVIPNGSGTVSVEPRSNSYPSGTIVSVTAYPKAGQSFAGWSGDANGSQNPLSVTMDQSKVITANFTQRPSFAVQNQPDQSGFRLTLMSDLGSRYQVQSTTDLLNWQPAATVTNLYGVIQLADPSATNLPMRFYRANPAP